MAEKSWTFTIESTPVSPSLESVAGLTIAVRSPRNDTSVTVMVNPGLGDFQQVLPTPSGIKAGQFLALTPTEETVEYLATLGERNLFPVAAVIHALTLLRVHEVSFQGQQFPAYDFRLERYDVEALAEHDDVPVWVTAFALYGRGVRRRLDGGLEAAEEDFARVIDLKDEVRPVDWAFALDNRGFLRSKRGDHEGAGDDYTQIINNPDVPLPFKARMLVNRAYVREQAGDKDGARADTDAVINMADAPEDQKQKAREIQDRLS